MHSEESCGYTFNKYTLDSCVCCKKYWIDETKLDGYSL